MMDETSKTKPIYGGSYKIETEILTQGLEEIKIDEFKELGEKFKENMEQLDLMISLPITICTIERAKLSLLPLELRAEIRRRIRQAKSGKKEGREEYLKDKQAIWKTEYEPRMHEIVSEAMGKGEEIFGALLKEDFIYQPYQALLYAGIVWTWCSFEVLMKDLWEAALNMGGKQIRKNILGSITRSPRAQSDRFMQGKYLSLDYLAKFDYNLSSSLGRALSYKFDFSSPYGIKEAYLCTFPRSVTIKEALQNKALVELEARRSVIVHRAGVLDNEFCNKTGTKRREIGKKLELSSEDVYQFGNAVIDIGLKIMKAVSSIISRSKGKV